VSEWQPIETAPQGKWSSECVLLRTYKGTQVASWAGEERKWVEWFDGEPFRDLHAEPYAWMPIPAYELVE
jgi:hypothetical protein